MRKPLNALHEAIRRLRSASEVWRPKRIVRLSLKISRDPFAGSSQWKCPPRKGLPIVGPELRARSCGRIGRRQVSCPRKNERGSSDPVRGERLYGNCGCTGTLSDFSQRSSERGVGGTPQETACRFRRRRANQPKPANPSPRREKVLGSGIAAS